MARADRIAELELQNRQKDMEIQRLTQDLAMAQEQNRQKDETINARDLQHEQGRQIQERQNETIRNLRKERDGLLNKQNDAMEALSRPN